MSHAGAGRKLIECSVLPAGWKRQEICRKSGLSAGKIDVVYFSPTGVRCRTKHELARALGRSVDLTYFDFSSGRLSSLRSRDDARHRRNHTVDYSRGLHSTDRSGVASASSAGHHLVPPIRQTASIFRQPVTLVTSCPDSVVKTELPPSTGTNNNSSQQQLKTAGQLTAAVGGGGDKPRQLFWEKRLQGLRACDINHQRLLQLSLPRVLRAIGPHSDESVALRSLASALHVTAAGGGTGGAMTGQSAGRHLLDKNPAVFVDPAQPLVLSAAISAEEVQRQQERVSGARRRLETAISALIT